MEARLDSNNYTAEELISVKAPATLLPYYNGSKLFERVDGQVKINGVICNYVKRRLYNDTIEFMCIPNNSLTKLIKAGDDYFKLVNDIQHSGQNKKTNHQSGLSKIFLADCYNDQHLFNLKYFRFIFLRKPSSCHFYKTLNFSSVIENPPEQA